MNRNNSSHWWLLDDIINIAYRYQNGGPWDHKPEIVALWERRNIVTIGGRTWNIPHDMWSNIHFGCINMEIHQSNTYSKDSILTAAQWNQAATWEVPTTGDNNELDIEYMQFGNQLSLLTDGELDRSTFEAMLLPQLERWSQSADPTAPLLAD